MQPIKIWLLVSRHSPTLYLQSLLVCDEKKNILLLLCFIFACRSARPGFPWIVHWCVVYTAQGPPVTCSPWLLSSRDFTVCGKPDGLVCRKHRLAAALPPLPAVCHSDVSAAIGRQESRLPAVWRLPPHRPVVKAVPCVRPRHHCHSSTTDTTQCQKCCFAMSRDESFPNLHNGIATAAQTW